MDQIANYVKAKVHNAVEEAHRPASVTEAQHKHLKAFPTCAACGATKECQAHHVTPYNTDPTKGALPENFITLCEHMGGPEDHLHCGHGGDFKHWNPNVVADAKALAEAKSNAERFSILDRIKANRKVNAPSPHFPKD